MVLKLRSCSSVGIGRTSRSPQARGRHRRERKGEIAMLRREKKKKPTSHVRSWVEQPQAASTGGRLGVLRWQLKLIADLGGQLGVLGRACQLK